MAKGKSERFTDRYRVSAPKRFSLGDIDPSDTGPFDSKRGSDALLQQGIEQLTDLQDRLYAQDRWGVLMILQATDAAGKDSTIKHVMSGVNPQGCEVHSFKQPSSEELDHDFMWRAAKRLPERGRIGIFNRSYYEEVLVVRVHPEILGRQQLPSKLVTRNIWKDRFEDINAYERYLARNGYCIRKFFLHASKAEQKKRFLERLDRPDKHWKFSLADVEERSHWEAYQQAYEDMIRHTSTPHAPWYVVPADHKWFTRLVVAAALIEAMEGLALEYPKVDSLKRRELAAARSALEGEGGKGRARAARKG